MIDNTECLGCVRMEYDDCPTATLYDGTIVCTYCDQWRLETLAKYLLTLPAGKRNNELAQMDKKLAIRLKARMENLNNVSSFCPRSPAIQGGEDVKLEILERTITQWTRSRLQ